LRENKNLTNAFSDPAKSKTLLQGIAQIARLHSKDMVIMEVCGTHTVSIFKSGIRTLLPENIKLISGPGCPVCVTPNEYLDRAIALSRLDSVTITTFGDMMRVPGTKSSLEKEKTKGADVRVVYSTRDALKVAAQNPGRRVIFLGVGFETTAPTVASALKEAKSNAIDNFWVLSTHKLIPPAMKFLVQSPDLKIDGFLCPGHVSTIIGSDPYRFVASEYKIPCVIAGFEPLDILQATFMLVWQIKEKKHLVENQYARAVKPEGNTKAQSLMREVFYPEDTRWRGIGIIPQSGLGINREYELFDGEKQIKVEVEPSGEPSNCLCGEVILGKIQPSMCALFGCECTPESPVGPCMVSSEGTCAAHFKYDRN
jgi:hydrogenase expression/formation protein HypD